jgi:hypothetical protein
MPTKEQIEGIINRHFPAPAQPSDAVDSLVEWEREQAAKVVADVLLLTLNHAAGIEPQNSADSIVDLTT